MLYLSRAHTQANAIADDFQPTEQSHTRTHCRRAYSLSGALEIKSTDDDNIQHTPYRCARRDTKPAKIKWRKINTIMYLFRRLISVILSSSHIHQMIIWLDWPYFVHTLHPLLLHLFFCRWSSFLFSVHPKVLVDPTYMCFRRTYTANSIVRWISHLSVVCRLHYFIVYLYLLHSLDAGLYYKV